MQIAEYAGGRQRIVKHVGSAHSEAELGVLMAKARELLEPVGQESFELGVEPTPPVVPLVRAAAGQREVLPAGRGSGGPVRSSAARVVSTDARVLFEALAGVYSSLGFDAVGDEVFKDLVIARVVEPTSLLDTGRVLTDLGRVPASYATMKRTLARAVKTGNPDESGARQDASPAKPTVSYRDTVAGLCFAHAVHAGDLSLVLYDCTTLYFEAEHEDELRKVGYSKERRVDPQVVVGLLVDRNGFPLEVSCFEGNRAETTTIIPLVRAFAARHRVTDMVVVADAGMLSVGNLTELHDAGLRFIVGSKTTKAPADLASHLRWHTGRLHRRAGHRHPDPPGW